MEYVAVEVRLVASFFLNVEENTSIFVIVSKIQKCIQVKIHISEFIKLIQNCTEFKIKNMG